MKSRISIAPVLLERRKSRQRADRCDAGARRLAVRRQFARDVDRALVAQLGHPGNGVRSDHVEIRVALQRFRQMGERALVARLAEREHGLRLDKVAGVAGGDDVGERGRRARVAAKIAERAHDGAPRLRMRQLESFDQRVECGGGANRAERGRRVGLHAPEVVGEHRVAQCRGRLRAAFVAEFARCVGTTDRFGRMAQRGFERLAPALVLERLQNVVLGIEAHRLRAPCRMAKVKPCSRSFISTRCRVSWPSASISAIVTGKVNAEAIVSPVLWVCLTVTLSSFFLSSKELEIFDLRMPFLVHPLVEEKIEVAAGRVLERALQVLRDHVGAAMPRAIEIERLEKQLVAGRHAEAYAAPGCPSRRDGDRTIRSARDSGCTRSGADSDWRILVEICPRGPGARSTRTRRRPDFPRTRAPRSKSRSLR